MKKNLHKNLDGVKNGSKKPNNLKIKRIEAQNNWAQDSINSEFKTPMKGEKMQKKTVNLNRSLDQ